VLTRGVMRSAWLWAVAMACLAPAQSSRPAVQDADWPAEMVAKELRVKREESFGFARKPAVTRRGDRVTVSFATQGFCDVTVAVEDADGNILRHLASGVLGENAPPPFKTGSKEQVLIWDSKDDQGLYVDDRANTVVRVSLGLRARFERHFLWSPHRRFEQRTPSFCAQPEGVYVFDGTMTDFIYLFDPTSETQLRRAANSAMAIRDGRIAVAYYSLNRLATDGTTGGLPLEGPETYVKSKKHEPQWWPRDLALSPDGKWAYVTGFHKHFGIGSACWTGWLHGVGRMDMAAGKKGDPMETFAGDLRIDREAGGSEPGRFKVPSSVDCDPQGRVYVNDHFNDRVQVFDPSGTHLKDIRVAKPAEVCVDPRNGQIYVFSWALDSRHFRKGGSDGYGQGSEVQPTLTHLGPFENPKVLAKYSFPIMDDTLGGGRHGGTEYRAIVDQRGKGRFLATSGADLPLGEDRRPNIPPQLHQFWVEDAKWIYPAAGFARHNAPCICWNCRFAIDLFGRSFIPATVRNQVAVLDTNGNLILHVGQYGNVDDGVPLAGAMQFRTQQPRSIGGDEVSLVYACHTATHSDRRLFIADAGNGRILSVKLDYHTHARVPLADARKSEKGELVP